MRCGGSVLQTVLRDKAVTLVCEDAGAAAALAPVARHLIARAGSIGVVAVGAAAATLASLDVPSTSTLDSLSSKTSVLVTGTTAWGERIEARAILRARELEVPSMSYIDFWSNYRERLSSNDVTRLDAVPNVVAVVDSVMRDDIRALGIADEAIVVTGSPLLEAMRRMAPAAADAPILFVSQPLSALAASSVDALGFDEREIVPMVAQECARHGRRLRVRAHPREDLEALAALVAQTSPSAELSPRNVTLREDVRSCCACIGMNTMALVESALMGRPTLSVQPTLHPIMLPTIRNGMTVLARTQTEVGEWIARLECDEGQRSVTNDNDGATARIVALIDDLAGRART